RLAVHAHHVRPTRGTELRGRNPTQPEPNDVDVLAREFDHRSFSEDRPISASNIEMIQNRTIILGSAQPFFSKWWWMGAIKNTRLPNSLKDTTCVTTLTFSTTKMPPTSTLSSSFLVRMANMPSPPPRAREPT